MKKLLIVGAGIVISNQEHIDSTIIIVVFDNGNFYYDKIITEGSDLLKYITYQANCFDGHIALAIKVINYKPRACNSFDRLITVPAKTNNKPNKQNE